MNNNQHTTNLSQPLIVSGILVIAMLLLSVWTWFQLPSGVEIPVHWGIDGQPDRYGSPFEGLFLLPLVSIAVVALLYFIPRIEPRKFNLAQSMRPYKVVWTIIIIFLAVIHLTLTLWVLGYGDLVPINVVISVTLGLMFIGMGNMMGKVRSNHMFGIRTPWTLASDLSWDKTHRLGGKLFLLFGVVLLLGGLFFDGNGAFALLMIGLFGILIVLFPYSYWIWKNDATRSAE